MRCNIQSVKSPLRSVRPLNDPYGSNELNKPLTDRYNAGVLDNPQMGFTLNFRKCKVALSPMYRIFLKLCPKVSSYPSYQNSTLRKNFTAPFLKYNRLKLKLRVFLAGNSVAMVTYCVTKIIPTCSPVIG